MINIKQKYKGLDLEIIIDEIGAQIIDCKVSDGNKVVHLMHNGATTPGTSWDATAKNLFPNPGPVLPKTYEGFDEAQAQFLDKLNANSDKSKTYTHRGGLYTMKQHGFAQSKKFDVQGQGKDYAVLSLRNDDQTTSEFPNKFAYHVVVSLAEKNTPADEIGFKYQTVANNLDTKPMVAGMGWHPSFAMPFGKENYKVIITGKDGRHEEYSAADILDKGKATELAGGEIDVHLIYVNPENKQPYLVTTMTSNEKVFILWGRNGQNSSDFICLEPWNTSSRKISNLSKKAYMSNQDLLNLEKDGVKMLDAGEVSQLSANVVFGTKYLDLLLSSNFAKEIDNNAPQK